jgi:outer membrane protein TolC
MSDRSPLANPPPRRAAAGGRLPAGRRARSFHGWGAATFTAAVLLTAIGGWGAGGSWRPALAAEAAGGAEVALGAQAAGGGVEAPGGAQAVGRAEASGGAQAAKGGAQATEDPAAAAGAPLTLGRATRLAIGSSQEVAAAAALVRSDVASARLVADAFRPEAGVSSTPGIGRGLPMAVAGQVPAIVTVGVHRTLYNSEQRVKGLSARATTAGARAAYERQRLATARSTADLYARCWSDQQLLAGAERRLAAHEAMSRRAAALHDQGRVTELDLAQARLREARARLHRMEIAATREVDQWELTRRLGLPTGTPLVLPADPLADLAGASPGPGTDDLALARTADPDLRSDAARIVLLEGARQHHAGWLSPLTLDAEAQYSRLSRANGIDQFYVKFREDDWSVALAVSYPLWSGGRLRDSLNQADANLERLKSEEQGRAEELEIEVHRAQAAVDQAVAGLAITRQATAVAEEDLRLAGALAAEGRGGPDDLDSREVALAETREEEIKATANLLNARVQLLAVRGDLLPRLGVDDPAVAAAAPAAPPPAAPPGAPATLPAGN